MYKHVPVNIVKHSQQPQMSLEHEVLMNFSHLRCCASGIHLTRLHLSIQCAKDFLFKLTPHLLCHELENRKVRKKICEKISRAGKIDRHRQCINSIFRPRAIAGTAG